MNERTTLRTLFLTAAAVGLQALLLGGLASPAAADWREEAIVEAFEDVLDREPSDRELRRYLSRMEEDGWTERDVRDDLRERGDDRRHSHRAHEDPEKVIRRAYDDILHREPDADGLRLYRSRMIDDGWSESDVREALRESPEFAEEIVRRAYEDVLGREPDAASGGYVDRILRDHWTEEDVARELRNSDEYRNKR
jgi:hypothetical protein